VQHPLLYQPIELDPSALQRFSTGVKERLRSSDPAFRRDWLRLFVDRIVIGPEEIRILGPKKAMLAGDASGDELTTTPAPSFARGWRAKQDKDGHCNQWEISRQRMK
jgi:site-specific DNA recombinase